MNTEGLPSAADLDAVAEEQRIAAATAGQQIASQDSIQDGAAGE